MIVSQSEAVLGSEHLVELSLQHKVVVKTTKPPGFGLIPVLQSIPLVNLRASEAQYRQEISFQLASPLEYLQRWISSNEVFGDDIQLVSVVRWADQQISFVITQPQYHGIPAENRDIETHFLKAGWERLNEPSGHTVFYNFAYDVMAIDAERRNCYLNGEELYPFDVLLFQPDTKMASHLGIG